MIRTITIEREYGAGGAAIAERLAERLGWKLWDQALTAEIARLAKVDQACVERMAERCDSAFYRLMKVFIRQLRAQPARNGARYVSIRTACSLNAAGNRKGRG